MRRKQGVRPHWATKLHAVCLVVGVLAAVASRTPATAFESEAREALLIDAGTGTVLFEKNAQQPMPPASMSKIMTVHMVFEQLREGRLTLEDTVAVSENAWRKGGAKSGGSTMFLKPNSEVSIEELLYGIVVQSGNDASIVVAEALSGSEEEFARQMTERAREMGLENTTFRNSTGLPDPEHLTTAEDLALIAARTILEFPEYYARFYGEKDYTYNGIRQGNRNPLLYKDVGADGLKTGHTTAAGYGLTASAERDGRRLILVLNGLPNAQSRSDEAQRLIDWGFRAFDNYKIASAGDPISEAEVWLGTEDAVPLTVDRDLEVTLTPDERDQMTVTVKYDGPIPAPIHPGDPVATLVVSVPGHDPLRVPLVAGQGVERLGVVGRLFAALESLVMGQLN